MQQTYTEAPSPARVTRIPDLLVNQIAAGEVVERPASALKEMLENSLDAGATRIDVALEQGGMQSITVVDDGSGIHPDDLALSLERHATSKIRQAEDLESIATYGFRGEALASIASVAQVRVQSRTQEHPHGFAIEVVHGEQKGPARPVACSVGTTITVSGLFERLPARHKYLRSGATELSHCSRVVRELAVGNPQVAFHLTHQGRTLASYTAPTRGPRIREVFKWDWRPLHFEDTTGDLAVEAFLTPADWTQDRGELVLFVNQRPVRNRSLLAAVRQAYSGALGPHHDPSGVIYLDIRKDWVDVNVHPQKTEVRCLKQQSLYAWLLQVTRKAIAANPSVRPIGLEPNRAPTLPGLVEQGTPTLASPEPVRPAEPPRAFVQKAAPLPATGFLEDALAPAVPVPRPEPQTLPLSAFATVAKQSRPGETAPNNHHPRGWRYLGQIRAAYLLCEDEQGLLIIDQHALHEKMKFEQLRREQLSGGLKSQRLLLPKIVRVPADLLPVLEDSLELLQKAGFELTAFGDGDWAIQAIPELATEAQTETMLLETLRSLRDGGEAPEEIAARTLHKVLATIACHSVVRAGQVLGPEQAQTLLAGTEALELGWTCPHGRPVVFRLGFDEIEKHFERT